jgi:hypothetical protein
MGLILQATLGGVAADFRSQQISDRVFKFVVASRNVGFHIYKLRSYCCDQYKVFFNLCGNGGPNWQSELRNFLSEEDNQWTLVTNRRLQWHSRSYADVVKDFSLTGASRVPLGNRVHSPRFHHAFRQVSNLHLLSSNRYRRFPNHLPHRISVFQRFELPRARPDIHRQQTPVHAGQAKNRESISKFSSDVRNVRVSNFESTINRDKGKKSKSSSESSIRYCDICPRMGHRLPLYKSWSVCFNCYIKGHMAAYCPAQWKPIGKSLEPKTGNWINHNGTSLSKEPLNSLLADLFPANVSGDSSSPPLRTELQQQNPPLQHLLSSTLPSSLQIASPRHPMATSVPLTGNLASSLMAYQWVDLQFFVP